MPFLIRDLSVMAYANGFTLWHYKAAPGGLQAVGCAGFFDAAADMLASGDMMLVSAPEGGRMLCVANAEGKISAAALS